MLKIESSGEGLSFHVVVQPRSSRPAVVGEHQQALKIKLTAAPVEGAANRQCIELLAKALGLPKSALSIAGGHKGRRKQILIRPPGGPLSEPRKRELVQKLRRLGGEETHAMPPAS